jgi:hypothetical protein
MKTFIAALIIFALLAASVTAISCFAVGRIDALSELAKALPEGKALPPDAVEKAAHLHAEWEKSLRFLVYTASYDILAGASEAANALSAASRAESADDFASARLRFIEAMRRLRLLFSVSAESVL